MRRGAARAPGHFLADHAALLGREASGPVPADPSPSAWPLRAWHFRVASRGVPVDGARVTAVTSRGLLTAAHVVGSGPADASPTPAVSSPDALDAALPADSRRDVPTRVLPDGRGHRLRDSL